MSAPAQPSARILIADDQADVLEALRLLLWHEGYVVETVTSPAAVLEALGARTFDALLIDLNYARDTTSGREGIELLSRVQAMDNALPTIVMTGWATIEVAVEAMRHGAREFVQKPWDNDALLALLRRQVTLCKSLRRKQRVEIEKRREALMAAEAQRRLLPQRVPASSALDFFAVCQPARDVGGDYYDFIETPPARTCFVVADVEGKGMAAALLVSTVQAAVRSQAHRDGQTPARLVASVNDLLRTSADATSYASLFYAHVDEETRTLTYVNAGHNPPLLRHASRSGGRDGGLLEHARHPLYGRTPAVIEQRMTLRTAKTSLALEEDARIERLEAGGPVIGFFEDCVYEEGVIALASGDVLVAYSDGLTEAFSPDGEEFGEQRLSDILLENPDLDAHVLGARILEEVRDWSNHAPLHDDLTLVIMKVK
jgi:sigma-B regulation protein RsbU (phosphoserine phosphatase)